LHLLIWVLIGFSMQLINAIREVLANAFEGLHALALACGVDDAFEAFHFVVDRAVAFAADEAKLEPISKVFPLYLSTLQLDFNLEEFDLNVSHCIFQIALDCSVNQLCSQILLQT